MTKITAIESGNDWYDAGVDYLVLPAGMVIKDELREYWRGVQRESKPLPPLHAWLVQRGARAPTDEELEVVSDD